MLKPRGTIILSYYQMGGSCDCQTGGAEDAQVRVGKQLQAAKGLNQKQTEWEPKKIRVCWLFLVGWWRREMLKLMVLMTENQSDCHRSLWQQFRVLRHYGTGPGLSSPTLAAQWGGRGLSHHTPVMWWGEGLGRSTWTHNWSCLGFTLPSKTFMHRTVFTTVFSIKYSSRHDYFVTQKDK